MHTECWWESQKERDHEEDLGDGRRIILKWISKKYVVMWTEFIWLRTGIIDRLLWTQ
jgi:hypothetical protein